MKNGTDKKRAALLIRCTVEEAEQIREAAQHERRTISGFILHVVMGRIATREKLRRPPRPVGKADGASA